MDSKLILRKTLTRYKIKKNAVPFQVIAAYMALSISDRYDQRFDDKFNVSQYHNVETVYSAVHVSPKNILMLLT